MSISAVIVVVFLVVSLILYAVTAGADFGGGVWELFARGPRADDQRKLISHAIGPVWEANHVWLILVIVLLFVAFPPAFYAIMVALHLPLFLMLLGIVLRGSSYVFQAYGEMQDAAVKRWTRVFSISSAITPLLLGICLGGVISGDIVVATDGREYEAANYLWSWLQPFPLAMGTFVLSLFCYLAAIYLAVEADNPALREDFRRRALGAAIVVGATALGTLVLARTGAPVVWDGLVSSWWSIPFHVGTGVLATATIASLMKRRFQLARLAAGAHVVVMISGWAFAQFPYIVPGQLTFEEAVTANSVTTPLAIALCAGLVFLVPAFVYLYGIFKGDTFGSAASN